MRLKSTELSPSAEWDAVTAHSMTHSPLTGHAHSLLSSLTQLYNEPWDMRRGPHKSQFSLSLKHQAFCPQTSLTDTCSQFKTQNFIQSIHISRLSNFSHSVDKQGRFTADNWANNNFLPDKIKNWVGTDSSFVYFLINHSIVHKDHSAVWNETTTVTTESRV